MKFSSKFIIISSSICAARNNNPIVRKSTYKKFNNLGLFEEDSDGNLPTINKARLAAKCQKFLTINNLPFRDQSNKSPPVSFKKQATPEEPPFEGDGIDWANTDQEHENKDYEMLGRRSAGSQFQQVDQKQNTNKVSGNLINPTLSNNLKLEGIDNSWTNDESRTGLGSLTLMSWQMNSQGILQYANAEGTNPNRPNILKFPSTENMWDRYARLMNMERNIRAVSPDILMLQSIQITEAAMLMDDIRSAGYEIRQKTLVERPNTEFLWNMILIKDKSPFQPLHSFSLEMDRKVIDDIGVLVLKNTVKGPPTLEENADYDYYYGEDSGFGSDTNEIANLVLINIKLRSQTVGSGSSYSEIMQKALQHVKVKLRDLKVRNYRLILAGNFLDNPNSLQLQEIKREGFVDISFELPNPKPVTWTHPLKVPQRRSYIFIKDGIKIENFSTLLLQRNWKKNSSYDNWYRAIKEGSNHFPLYFKFRIL